MRQLPFKLKQEVLCFQFSINSVFSLSPPVTFVPVPLTPLIDPLCHNSLHRYQINARTEMALRYNDISPLENHHCAVAFQIFSQPDCNIFFNFDPEAFKQIRQVLMCSCRNRSIVWVNTCTTMAKIIILLFDETLHKIFNRCFRTLSAWDSDVQGLHLSSIWVLSLLL